MFRKDYPGDDPGDDPVGGGATVPALADQLPLLRHVGRVRYWVRAADWEPRYDVTLPAGSVRCRFDETDPTPVVGVGRVKADPAGDRDYALRERWVPALAALRASDAWPTSMSFETVEPAKDKALPHAAVTVSRGPAPGGGSVSVGRAVFLPLGDDEERRDLGLPAAYSVRLHGCFFVDAGRKGPVVRTGSQHGANPSAEDQLRAEWNDRLLREGARPLLLPALDDLVRTARPDDAQVRAVTRALCGANPTLLGVPGNAAAVLRGGQWLFRWSPTDPGWRLLGAGNEYLELPDFDPAAATRVGQALPGLAGVAARANLTPADGPRSADPARRTPWTDALLAEALGGAPDIAAWDEAHWDYLARFLGLALAGPPVPAVAERVAGLLRRAFVTVAVHTLRRSREAVRAVVGHLPPDARLSLPGLGALTEAERRDRFDCSGRSCGRPGPRTERCCRASPHSTPAAARGSCSARPRTRTACDT